MCGSKSGKAFGHDGIAAECYKNYPAETAMILIPLAIKQSGLLTEPLQYKGGEAKELYKRKGPTTGQY